MKCVICREPVPELAKKCKCGAYTSKFWRGFFFVATVLVVPGAIVALASGVMPAYFYVSDYNSHTHFKVAGADENNVFLKVWNTGHKPSALLHYHLIFDAIKDRTKEITLEVGHEDKGADVVTSGNPVQIALTTPAGRPATEYTPDEVKELIGKQQLADIGMTLKVDVEESNSKPGGETRSDQFPADRIREFVKARYGLP